MSEWELLASVVAAMSVATFIRSFLGFGDALVAMPILSLLIGVREAAPFVAIISFITALCIVGAERNSIDWKPASWLIGSSVIAVPAGIYLLRTIPEQYVQAFLAFVIIGFCCLSFLKSKLARLENDRLITIFGAAAGVLVGAYNTPGPVLVIYGTMRNWSRERFRANLQAYFLPISLIVGTVHVTTGGANEGLWLRIGTALPFVLLAIWGGSTLSRRVGGEVFQRFVYGALVIVALMLLFDSIGEN
ncbi:MAG: permease [Planctomycetaceae bacterium]|nr:permease [Planctomycetaceae bacterium]